MAFQKKPYGGGGGRLADYAEVKDRLLSFRKKFPDGRIHTDLIKWEGDIIVMKAWAYADKEDQEKGLHLGTGYAFEREGSSQVNKTSALENCETSAVGRALAMAGFDIRKSVASKQEVENAIHQQEHPQPESKAPQSDEKPPRGSEVTESKMKAAVIAYAKQNGYTEQDVMDMVMDVAKGVPTDEDWKTVGATIKKAVASA